MHILLMARVLKAFQPKKNATMRDRCINSSTYFN
eukprot:CAMPEP_0183435284 /NCGR_PEP_ID=MMETSP0370-20130417/67209_1 /TAXON_ID=268820 /ORGANISM="Peridinium aciculiferum, Strain PAER-2" /LENGTH=33 /DNA_ID= /DNA_START= /DNA_END= /DNA_ORIENTATION=